MKPVNKQTSNIIEKVLIANRGEIALRVLRTCKEMGIQTIAIHSDVDADSLHVRFADEAICIGPAENSRSYLNVASILSAAEITDTDAIHPGYGFLAENPLFAEICETCNIIFIGPTPETIRLVGDKSKAREVMKKAGIPIVPGSNQEVVNEKKALEIANEIGYPLIIKAVAGGGGRGMRVVHFEKELESYFKMAQSEAAAAFGSSKVYIEKYIENPRHIEFQILADKYGNVIHLGERECSIQRRHQKLLEETPSIALSSSLRKEMGEAALEVARIIKYRNAGTVEFLVDSKNRYYFIEVNARIQVEHPVTEMITGIDVVKEQILLARGKKLQYQQKDIKVHGHSIEMRINAEDPRTFTPCLGTLTSYNLPGGIGVRVDTSAYVGYKLLPYYDSLLAKLIVHAEDRKLAIAKAARGLDEFIIEGIKTTIPFHKLVVSHPEFKKGEYSTSFVDQVLFKES
ncbi:MAG: acetyl-CoA carboxylase biotin carboxylase subunit [Candidatus Schekmanbacteria bacterium RBG_13_48_7]|uniref:Biotin carboxylase n=1 Tax=Candidatus Schekmanbacteria bacterium RBG_13_48_7 TaxID=1817878 RepID=A0A1F7RMV4_9BACT|nr:MAG: acetyl-CoA carboxylase biotin carboxylase subunit [Candidatus Schekmanbacteria bacterium RBG_13_48_7]